MEVRVCLHVLTEVLQTPKSKFIMPLFETMMWTGFAGKLIVELQLSAQTDELCLYRHHVHDGPHGTGEFVQFLQQLFA